MVRIQTWLPENVSRIKKKWGREQSGARVARDKARQGEEPAEV